MVEHFNMEMRVGLLLTYHYLIKSTKLQCLEPVDKETISLMDANLRWKQLLKMLKKHTVLCYQRNLTCRDIRPKRPRSSLAVHVTPTIRWFSNSRKLKFSSLLPAVIVLGLRGIVSVVFSTVLSKDFKPFTWDLTRAALISLRNALFCSLYLICDCLLWWYKRHGRADRRINLSVHKPVITNLSIGGLMYSQ